MRGEGCAVKVDHAVGVAVVGGDAGHAAHLGYSVGYLLYAPVYSLYSLDRRVKHACVSNHVAVCEVEYDNVILTALDSVYALFGDLIGAHMRLHIVGGYGRRLDEYAILALILLFYAAVEEEGDMSVLLGLGNTQLGFTVLRQILAHGVDQLLRLECDIYVGHGSVVLSHAHIVYLEEAVFALKAAELGVYKGACDLTRSVGTEVVEDHAVVLFYGVAALDDSGYHELVCHAVVIAVLNSLNGAALLDALAVYDGAVRLFYALPAVISVHGVVAAHDGSYLAYADFLALFDSLSHILLSARGGHVASVEKGVDVYLLKTSALSQLEDAVHMCVVAVHAARRQQTEEMQRAVVLDSVVDSLVHSLVIEEVAVLDSLGDAGQLLIYYPARAHVGVADLAVAHLSVGQTDV